MHLRLSFSWSNNQQEPLDYNNKVGDFNQRSDYRNNKSSDSSERDLLNKTDNKKSSSEFYFYKNPDNSVERVELRVKPAYSDRRVEELRDSHQHPASHSPSPERRSRISSPLLQRRHPGYSSPGQQRKSLEVSVPQVPVTFATNSLQRPRRVNSSQRWSGENIVTVSNTNLGFHSPQVNRRSVPLESGSPLLQRHRLGTLGDIDNTNSIGSVPGSPLRSSTSVLASLDKSILQIRYLILSLPLNRM